MRKSCIITLPFFAIGLFFSLSALGQEPIRVMPLGDSITRGTTFYGDIPGGYRTRFSQNLTSAGVTHDMVGTYNDNPPLGDIDPYHQGTNGFRTDQIETYICGWLSSTTPDVILLHAGTNDILQGRSSAETLAGLESLVDVITRNAPSAELYVSSIIPITQDYDGRSAAELNATVDGYNAGILPLIEEYSLLGRNINYVDMNGLVDLENFFGPSDGIHPGQAGYDQMGDIWSQAVTPVPEPCSAAMLTILSSVFFLKKRCNSRL